MASPTKAAPGFEGFLSNLSLPDLLQLHGQGRFSGSIAVSNDGQEGQIFLQNGEVVHAEAGDLKGEEAFCAILGWSTGNFAAHANVSTFSRTVFKGLDHLLLEAHRRMDEVKKAPARPPPLPKEPPPPAPKRGTPSVVSQLRAIPGVTYAVVFNREGMPIGDASPAAEALAARGLYLVTTLSAPLGQALGLGDLQLASVSSPGDQLLLFQARDTYLAASISEGASLADAEAAVRRALSPSARGR
ncbi:MAG TPA: DUF4388 domain-containing protein [Anaeromyxobacteraceae bacterium]|nr:DUF4388 domain-containing protein [Anaeromyxobacteraceae bacterium]